MAEKQLSVDELNIDGLKEELKKLSLSVKGSKAVLRERLRKAIRKAESAAEAKSRVDDEEGDEDDADDNEKNDEDSENADSDCDSKEDIESNATLYRRAKVTKQSLSFKDVEDSMQTFSGDKKENVRKWIEEFEETSKISQWTEAEKIIYAKKLLRGSAKLFVSYEKCASTWKKLKKSLIEEFSKTVSSKSVHKELDRARKRNDESYHDYMYRMMEIASHADIELESKIQYIIDGIPDEPMNKSILYSARNVSDLRKRLTQYEEMKHNQKFNQRSQPMKSGKEMRREGSRSLDSRSADVRRCHNCGGRNHLAAECPVKSRGTKCFQCKEFGHIAANCGKQADNKQVNECKVAIRYDQKIYKTVNIRGKPIVALLDTGSDLHLIKAEEYIKLGSPSLTGPSISCKSLGKDCLTTLGSFVINATIDDNDYDLTIHVISDTCMNHCLLLGSDLLRDANIKLSENNAIVTKRNDKTMNPLKDSEVPEIFNINIEETVSDRPQIDLSNIKDDKLKHRIEEVVKNYVPQNIKQIGIKLDLVLKDDVPVYERARRLAPIDKDVVNKHIREWMQAGIVRPSISEYASPVVLVKKKNGDTRLCIDYRKLNKKIVKDRYPLPLIEDQMDKLEGSIFFSVLDLKNGFFHVPLTEQSCKYTAFIVPDGHYEFLKAPFGLCNSPAIFQKYINAIFREHIASGKVLTYMDDLIIPSHTEEDNVNYVCDVLATASEYGLNVNWKKCRFLEKKIEYLGHIVENGSIKPSERKTTAVINFPKPTCASEVQSFLGLTGYFRKFIPRYAIIARPLSDLLRKDINFHFGEQQCRAFETLKHLLSQEPVLKLYRTEAETELCTDASKMGFAAILLQRDVNDQKFHPVYYASWKTTEAEQKYSSYELEVLAIIKSLRKFRVYLLGIPFKIVTDCRAFSLTMNKKDLCVRVARWALLLEEFNYAIEHRPGKSMRHVDALSRNPSTVMLIEEDRSSLVARITKAQHEDNELKHIFEKIRRNECSDFILQNNVLYRKCDDDLLLVVPKCMQYDVIKQAHDKGHFSVGKMEGILKKEFWFAHMRERIEKTIKNCISCILAERKYGKREGLLHNIPKGTAPLDTYHIDYLGPLSSTKKSYVHLLVIVDAFTKFAWLYPTRSTTAAEVISRLNKQSAIFGNPRRIISDRGSAFTSNDFKHYCDNEKIEHVLTTTGVPRSNGQVERFNRIVIPLFTKLSAPHPENWYKHVEKVQQLLNSTPSRSTGLTPFELLVGQNMRLRDDLELREIIERDTINSLQEKRSEMRDHAKNAIAKIQRENRENFNRKRKKANAYRTGDLVAIQRTQVTPGSKFSSKFFGPYEIVKVLRGDRYIVTKIGEHEGPRNTSTSADHMKRWLSSECVSDDESDDDTCALLTASETDDSSEWPSVGTYV